MKNTIIVITLLFAHLSCISQINNNGIRIYNVKNFGAKGDGTTDDTRAIQKAINQCALGGGGTVYIPNGKYILSDTLTNSGATNYVNSLLYIPSVATLSTSRTAIKIVGESNIITPSGYSNIVGFNVPTKGVILAGRTAGTGTRPAVISTKGTAGNYRDYNYNPIVLENLLITTNTIGGTAAPTLSGINMLHAATVSIRNVAVTLDTINQASVTPVGSEVAGFIISGDNNDGPNLIEGAYSSGYKYGYIVGDHTTLTNAYAFCSYYAFAFTAGDWSIQGRVGTAACVNQLYIPNFDVMGIAKDSSTFLDIVFETEVDSTAYHGIFWYSTQMNVIDSGNLGRGVVRWVNHTTAANTPISAYGSSQLNNLLLDRPIPATFGGTGFKSFTVGDILYANSTTTFSKIPVGSNNQVFTVSSGLPAWVTPGGGTNWGLFGNAGTTAGTNFVGTTDDINLIFKRRNIQSGVIDSTSPTAGSTKFGYAAGLNGASGTAFGFKALYNNTISSSTAFGNRAMLSNTTQTDNTAIGYDALYSNNSAGSNSNTAVGSNALYTTTNGSGNQTAVGAYALNSSTFGGGNTAVGQGALRYLTSTSGNIGIGVSAGAQYSGPSNMTQVNSSIFIGNNTLASSNSLSNMIVIGTSAVSLGSNTTVIGNSTTTNTILAGKLTVGTLALADTSAALDVPSTTKAFLPPRMTTTQRITITSGITTATRAAGTGYTNGTYTANALTGGTGTGATATLTIAGGAVTSAIFVSKGTGYNIGDILTGTSIGAGSGFTLTVTALTYTAEGSVVYDLTLHKLYGWDGTTWNAAW